MDNNDKYISGLSAERFEELPIKHLFFIALTAGGVSIVLGILWSSNILSVISPCLLVIAYAFFIARAKNSDLSKSKIGDSCYFLGFSFTLVSLSFSLINLSQHIDETVSLGSVVGGFGAALSTTLSGLLCRLWFTTLSSSFLSSKEKLEEEIESAMRSFSLQLQTLVENVNLSITSIGATIGDTNLELNASYKLQMETNLITISDTLDNFSERLNQIEVSSDMVVKPIAEAMSTMIDTLEKNGRGMSQAHANIIEGTLQVSKQIDLSNSLVNSYIGKFSGEFEKISDEQISVFKKTAGEISESVRQNFSDISEIKINLTDNIVNELNLLKNQLESVTRLTEENNRVLGENQNINIKSAQVLEKFSNKIPNIVKDLEVASSPISKSSSDINELLSSFVSLKENIVDSKDTLKDFSVVAKDVTRNLSATSKTVDQSSTQLSEDISEIYSSLAKQLKELRSSIK